MYSGCDHVIGRSHTEIKIYFLTTKCTIQYYSLIHAECSVLSADLKFDFGINLKKIISNESFEITSFFGTIMIPKNQKAQLQIKSAKTICSIHGISDSLVPQLITNSLITISMILQMLFAKFRCIFLSLAKNEALTSLKTLVNFSQLASEIIWAEQCTIS